MSINIKEFAESLKAFAGAKFVGLTYTSKSTNETARYTLILGASYINLLEKSLLELELKEKELEDFAKTNELSLAATKQAYRELVESTKKSLEAHKMGKQNENYTKAGVYATISPNLKVSLNDGTYEISGLTHTKEVIVPGSYKEMMSSAKTIAKNKLKKDLPIGRYRTFCLDPEHFGSMKMNGDIWQIEEVSK